MAFASTPCKRREIPVDGSFRFAIKKRSQVPETQLRSVVRVPVTLIHAIDTDSRIGS